jgi:hypothetical protein
VPGLLAAGKVDRTLRVIRKANEVYPQEASRTWAVEVGVLAELGLWDNMRDLARRPHEAAFSMDFRVDNGVGFWHFLVPTLSWWCY